MKKIFTSFLFLVISLAGFSQLSGYVTEGFESATFPPAGWTVQNVAGPTYTWTRSTTQFFAGTASAYIRYDAVAGGGEDWLITPQFTVAATDSVVFYMRLLFQGYSPDSLALKVSTTTNTTANFTTTLLKLAQGTNYPPNATSWNRYAVSLESYAGQNIYLAFKHYNIDGDGLYIDNVSIGTKPAKDITAVSVDVPANIPAAAFTPAATFRNDGSVAQTFDVTFNSTGYTSTKTITGLTVGASQQVTFDSWTPTTGNYQLTAYSSLSGDANLLTDTVRKDITAIGPIANNGWLTEVPLSAARWAHASTSYRSGPVGNDTAYLVLLSGSDASFNNTTSVTRFNTISKVWVTLAPIPVSRTQVQGFYANGKIYVFGGYTGSFIPTNRTDIYDIASDSWSTGTNMPTGVGDYAGAQYNDSIIYIIGGYSGSTDVNLVQVYNTNTNSWTAGTPFTGTAVAGARAAIARSKIVFTGGYNQTLATELSQAYLGTINPASPASITWSALPAYPGGPVGRHSAGSAPGGSAVYFTGGDPNGGGTSALNATYGYDLVTNTWGVLPDKPTAVSNIQTFTPLVRNDSLYFAATGGYNGTSVVTVNEWLNLGKASLILPIRLINFAATLVNKKTQLKWEVAEDGKGGHYTIQRSVNAVNFEDMQSVNAGALSRTIIYNAQDLLPYNGFTYYRLKITDAEGTISYSPVRSVKLVDAVATDIAVSVAPNPSQGMIRLSLQSNAAERSKVSVRITDVSGKIVTSHTIMLDRTSLSTYPLRAGTYFVQVTTSDSRLNVTEKVIVL